jgi:hypothetical protein
MRDPLRFLMLDSKPDFIKTRIAGYAFETRITVLSSHVRTQSNAIGGLSSANPPRRRMADGLKSLSAEKYQYLSNGSDYLLLVETTSKAASLCDWRISDRGGSHVHENRW